MPVLDARPKKTKADFMALPDETRAELIDGEIYMSASPLPRHQRIVVKLVMRIESHFEATGQGKAWVAPCDVHLPTGDIVQPDVVVVLRERLSILKRWIEDAPDIAVEIVSPSAPERDRVMKRALYARAGVREYWILDPDERSVEVLRLDDASFAPGGFFTGDATLVSRLLPGFAARLADLFAD